MDKYRISEVVHYKPTVDDLEDETIMFAKLESNGCSVHWNCDWLCKDREHNQ